MKKKRISVAVVIILLMQLLSVASYATGGTVIDEGTTLTSKGFTFYSAQDFDLETLENFVNVYKDGVEVQGITITKLDKKTITSGKATVIATNIPYRVTLPQQITTSGDIYTLEIEKELSAGMIVDYIKNMTLDVLLYDNFDSYTGTVVTGKNASGQFVRSSEGTDASTWLGNAWAFDNNGSGSYDTHAVLSIDNGRLKMDYMNTEDNGKIQDTNAGRIRSVAQAEHADWADYTVEYDLTALEKRGSWYGGVYPRANATGNDDAVKLYYTDGIQGGSIYLKNTSAGNSGIEALPAVEVAGHVEATAVASTATSLGSYTLIVDNNYICNISNAIELGGKDYITAVGTPRLGSRSDQDFCIDNLVVSKALDVIDFQIENSESYPSGNEIILDAPCTVDSDSLDVSDFSVYTGTGVDKVELNISGVTSVDSDSVKLTLEQNMKNKVGYTVDVVGSLKSEGKEVVFRGVSFTVEPNEIDVESITKSENTYTAILMNYRAAETTVFATLAAYDENNKLIGISGGNYTLATDTAEENRKITLTAADVSYVKCYILNGLANINTIAEEEFVAE